MASINGNPSHGGSSASSSCPSTPLSSHATSNKEDGTSNNANNNEKTTCSHFLISKIDFPDNNTRIEYFTDLEGNWDYFLTLVERSSVVFYDNNPDNNDDINSLVQKFRLAPNTILVHGGDVVDKGPGDIRIVKILVHLKQMYPSRVFLLCGNRDVNKLRFTSELDDEEEKSSMTTAPIYWNPKHVPYADYLENKGLLNDEEGISKLKWMLECTMGSPTTFETRRLELETLQQQDISDQDVFTSFRDSVHPNSNDPWMLDYLRHGQLMLVIGDCLFVHGGIIEACLGQVPGQENAGDNIPLPLLDWCQNLNQFFAAMIQEFVNQPLWTKKTDSRTRGGELLMDYGVPGGNHGATVVYNTFVENGNPQRPDSATIQYLRKAGITRVFVGHQPTGDCPWVIRVDDNDNNIDNDNQKELSIFLCDTSYSDVKANKTTNPANNRGAAVSNVMITRHETITKGILANGKQHGFTMKTTTNTNKVITTQEEKEQCDDSLGLPPPESTNMIGKQLLDGSWVKTILLASNNEIEIETKESSNYENEKMTFVVGKGEGWKVQTKEMEMQEVLLQIAAATK